MRHFTCMAHTPIAPTPDYYAVLGCTELSSTEQIAAEYRQLTRLWHPDKAQGRSASLLLPHWYPATPSPLHFQMCHYEIHQRSLNPAGRASDDSAQFTRLKEAYAVLSDPSTRWALNLSTLAWLASLCCSHLLEEHHTTTGGGRGWTLHSPSGSGSATRAAYALSSCIDAYILTLLGGAALWGRRQAQARPRPPPPPRRSGDIARWARRQSDTGPACAV
jgi:hypothetical protein